LGYFISDQQSAFFQSPEFSNVLSYAQQHNETCKLKEKQTRNGLRLLLIFDHIKSVNKALEVLQPLSQKQKIVI
jgi:transcription-repair coupling factor (superfamily II helicase)